MLNQKSEEEARNDPFLNIFEEGMDEFVSYQKQKGEDYKSKAQRHKEKVERLERDLNDAELRKQRNHERRQAEKNKLNKLVSTMSQQEAKEFYRERSHRRKEERQKVRNAMATGQVMMLDLVFQDKMNGKENRSLAKQIELIMQSIKQIDHPPSIHLCSLGGQTRNQLQRMGIKHWPITPHPEDIVTVGKQLQKKLVYLSPDAEEPLEKVQPDCAYILGGLIDRTIIKNASLTRAKELGIEARRLPIRQFMKSRIVLNLDHVVMMVCKYRDVGDWKVAFDFAAPKRWKRDAQNQQETQEGQEQKQQLKGQSSDSDQQKVEEPSEKVQEPIQ